MNARERVKKAICFDGPDCVPVLYFNSDKEKSDILIIRAGMNFMGENEDVSEWGFVWERMDSTMGQPKNAVLTDWSMLDGFSAPEISTQVRFEHVEAEKHKYGEGKYLLANMELTGFTIMSFLRGFADIIGDMVFEPENVSRLADIVFGFETELLAHIAAQGFDGVAFFDDWGMQNNLIISPDMWREKFKWRYKQQFDEAHRLGMDVYFHSCGYIYPIIEDLIEVGVDMLNISQPNLYDIAKLGDDFGGRVCFVCPVSYQTVSISGTRTDIFSSVQTLVENLGRFGGGLIGYIEEYSSIGMSRQNYQSCIDAFVKHGRY